MAVLQLISAPRKLSSLGWTSSHALQAYIVSYPLNGYYIALTHKLICGKLLHKYNCPSNSLTDQHGSSSGVGTALAAWPVAVTQTGSRDW